MMGTNGSKSEKIVPLNDARTSASSVKSGKSKSKSVASTRSGRRKKKKGTSTSSLGTDSAASNRDLPIEDQLALAKDQVKKEKAGKRKLFHSLVKLANELRRTRDESIPLLEQRNYADKMWYDGGIWRAPELLPGVYNRSFYTTRLREPISLTDLFFGLTIVTAFTRVGVAISKMGFVDINSLLYFGVFWSVWGKETSYGTRFDTSDLSAQAVTLVTCFAVLFASLSVQTPINSVDGGRVMFMAAFVAALHLLLHIRVVVTSREMEDDEVLQQQQQSNKDDDNGQKTEADPMVQLQSNIAAYGTFNAVMCFLELVVWLVGAVVFPTDWPYRWILFLLGILLALRVPRALLATDFHAACSKRGVLFILLLGFLLQSIIVVASEFFTYQTPTFEHYCFIGAACFMLFCMKLLYVDDSNILAVDHALMVNKTAAFLFNVGQFSLLLSTTVLGSGLNLLTHDYLAATQALPGPSKSMVCGGFSAVLFSTFFIKSMHLKRIPASGRGQCLFISAYLLQALTLLAVVGVTAAMCTGNVSGVLAALMDEDITLLAGLSLAAFVVVVMHWLDEGVELALYSSAEESRSLRVHPFGFWWCLKPDEANMLERSLGGVADDPSSISDAGFIDSNRGSNLDLMSIGESTTGLSVTTPLLDASSPPGQGYSSTLGASELV